MIIIPDSKRYLTHFLGWMHEHNTSINGLCISHVGAAVPMCSLNHMNILGCGVTDALARWCCQAVADLGARPPLHTNIGSAPPPRGWRPLLRQVLDPPLAGVPPCLPIVIHLPHTFHTIYSGQFSTIIIIIIFIIQRHPVQ